MIIRLNSLEFTIEYTTGGGGTITDAAGAPPNLVTAADGISLAPGEMMTVTFDVTVDPGTIGNLVNSATVLSNETLPVKVMMMKWFLFSHLLTMEILQIREPVREPGTTRH